MPAAVTPPQAFLLSNASSPPAKPVFAAFTRSGYRLDSNRHASSLVWAWTWRSQLGFFDIAVYVWKICLQQYFKVCILLYIRCRPVFLDEIQSGRHYVYRTPAAKRKNRSGMVAWTEMGANRLSRIVCVWIFAFFVSFFCIHMDIIVCINNFYVNKRWFY